MAAIDEPDLVPWRGADDGAVRRDRRRLGRVEANSALIPLLRGSAPLIASLPIRQPPDWPPAQGSFDFGTELIEPIQLDGLDDGGDPGRGTLLAILLCVPLWPVACLIACWLS